MPELEWYQGEEDDGWDWWDEGEFDEPEGEDVCPRCGCYGRLDIDLYVCNNCGEEWDAFPETPF